MNRIRYLEGVKLSRRLSGRSVLCGPRMTINSGEPNAAQIWDGIKNVHELFYIDTPHRHIPSSVGSGTSGNTVETELNVLESTTNALGPQQEDPKFAQARLLARTKTVWNTALLRPEMFAFGPSSTTKKIYSSGMCPCTTNQRALKEGEPVALQEPDDDVDHIMRELGYWLEDIAAYR